MANAVTSSEAIQAEVAAIVARNNQKITEINTLPDMIRSQMDLEIFDDIEYLLRYIKALHGVIEDLSADVKKESATFEFT